MSSLINRSHVRAYLLDYAARNRAQKFRRVSAAVFEVLDTYVREKCRQVVDSHPSKGVTISV